MGVTLVSKTTSSLTFRYTGLDPSYNQTIRNIYWELYRASDNSLVGTKSDTIPNLVSQTGTYTFSGLTSSTSYYVSGEITNIEGTPDVSFGAGNFTTDAPPPPPRPNDWVWSPVITQGSTVSITAAHWNDFTTRINQFRVYRNISSYSFTSAVSGNPITASIVNQAVSAINGISPLYDLQPRSVGENLTAEFFNDMRIVLNMTQ